MNDKSCERHLKKKLLVIYKSMQNIYSTLEPSDHTVQYPYQLIFTCWFSCCVERYKPQSIRVKYGIYGKTKQTFRLQTVYI